MAEGSAARVLLLLGPSAGGIRRHVALLRDGLEDRGWAVTTAGPPGVLEDLGGVDHEIPVGWSPAVFPLAVRRLRAAASGVDLVHAHGLKAGALTVAARIRPRVLTVHNVVLDESAGHFAPLLRRVERALPQAVEHTIPVSDEIARRLGIAHAPTTTVIVPAGPLPVQTRRRSEVRSALGIDDATPLVATAARLHPQKDLGTLLAAVATLHRHRPDVRVVIAGGGPSETELQDTRDRLGLAGVVDFLGPRSDVPDVLGAADVVALSSVWEGSPLVVAEAMLLGRPVVATAVGAVPEVVIDGETGRLVPPRDPDALAAALEAVLADPAAADAMARAGKAVADRRYSPSVLVDQVDAVYRRVLEELARGDRG